MEEKMNMEEYNDVIIPKIEIEDNAVEENDSIYFSISSFGADYTVDGLIKRLEKNQIVVPKFQRRYVWDVKKASRFIESLIIGLPVPGIFLSKDAVEVGKDNAGKTNIPHLIIDGQQRLLSLQKFYKGFFGEKKFRLTGVCEELNGKTYDELSPDDQGRLDDAIIHATIIKQESPDKDNSSIYMVFERLNTGGMLLQPQEIRACIYHGEFNNLLNELIKVPAWRSLFKKENPRMKEQEMVLRFFALYFTHNEYKKGLKFFLNSFMFKNRDLQLYNKNSLTQLFTNAITLIVNAKGNDAFRRGNAVNAALFDSIMIGVAKRFQESEMTVEECLEKYDALMRDSAYREYTTNSTADEKPLKERIRLSIEMFSSGHKL
jgi:uncharacterized protein with ParB-like and HNH nuclease domain